MPKSAKSAVAIRPEIKSSGRNAIRAEQGAPRNKNLSVPHLKLDEARKSKFIAYVAQNGSLEQSASQVDGAIHSIRSYRRLMATDAQFKNQVDDALAAFAGRVNEALISEAVEGVESYVIGKGEVVLHPETGLPLKVRKREAKLLAMLAASLNKSLRQVKTVVTVDGKIVDSEADPACSIFSSDLWQLSSSDSAEILRILKIIHENRNAPLALEQPMKTVADIEDATFSVVGDEECGDDPW